jgi:hypothetical protein
MLSPRDEAAAIGREAMTFTQQMRRRIRLILDRHHVYSRVFKPGGVPSQSALAVLEDLARYCHANVSTFRPDPRDHARLEGRREVYLYLISGMKLDQEQIAALTRQAQEETGHE